MLNEEEKYMADFSVPGVIRERTGRLTLLVICYKLKAHSVVMYMLYDILIERIKPCNNTCLRNIFSKIINACGRYGGRNWPFKILQHTVKRLMNITYKVTVIIILLQHTKFSKLVPCSYDAAPFCIFRGIISLGDISCKITRTV